MVFGIISRLFTQIARVEQYDMGIRLLLVVDAFTTAATSAVERRVLPHERRCLGFGEPEMGLRMAVVVEVRSYLFKFCSKFCKFRGKPRIAAVVEVRHNLQILLEFMQISWKTENSGSAMVLMPTTFWDGVGSLDSFVAVVGAALARDSSLLVGRGRSSAIAPLLVENL